MIVACCPWYDSAELAPLGKWRAGIVQGPLDLQLGYFATPEAAARADDVTARELFGEHAYQNFPDASCPSVLDRAVPHH